MRTDHELVAAWRGGDDAAGDELISRHFDAVYRFLYTKIEDGIEDLVQRTFLACVEARDRFRGESTFRVFLLGIAHRQLLLHFRRQHRSRKVFDEHATSVEQIAGSPSGIFIAQSEQALVLRALRRIPFQLQVALELHYWEEFTTSEIAAILDVPQGTVKSRLYHGRRRVREEIEKLATDTAVGRSTIENLERWARSLRELVSPKDDAER